MPRLRGNLYQRAERITAHRWLPRQYANTRFSTLLASAAAGFCGAGDPLEQSNQAGDLRSGQRRDCGASGELDRPVEPLENVEALRRDARVHAASITAEPLSDDQLLSLEPIDDACDAWRAFNHTSGNRQHRQALGARAAEDA